MIFHWKLSVSWRVFRYSLPVKLEKNGAIPHLEAKLRSKMAVSNGFEKNNTKKHHMVVGFVTFLKFVIIESHMVMVQLWDTEVMGLQLPHGYDIL